MVRIVIIGVFILTWILMALLTKGVAIVEEKERECNGKGNQTGNSPCGKG